MALPVWLTGVNGSYAVTITPQTNTNGTLADTTPVQTLTGSIDSINPESVRTNEEISAMNSGRLNHVALQSGTTFALTEILKYTGTNMLAQFGYAFDYGKVAVTRGAQTFTFYGLVENYSESLQRGKSTGTLRMVMVDNGAANPSYG